MNISTARPQGGGGTAAMVRAPGEARTSGRSTSLGWGEGKLYFLRLNKVLLSHDMFMMVYASLVVGFGVFRLPLAGDLDGKQRY